MPKVEATVKSQTPQRMPAWLMQERLHCNLGHTHMSAQSAKHSFRV